MTILQGYELDDIEWQAAGLRPGAMAGMLGNGMTLTVCTPVALHALFLCGCISAEALKQLKDKFFALWRTPKA